MSNNSRTRLLDPNCTQGHLNYTVPNGDTACTSEEDVSEQSIDQASKPSAIADVALLRNLENRRVWQSGDFWLLFGILSLRMCFQFLIVFY